MESSEPSHVALFYGGADEYVDGVLDFAASAVEAGEPLTVAVPGAKGELLDAPLREIGAQPEILDMIELGRNPARIIPTVETMLARAAGQRLHFVGEPIWPGRSPEEIREATRHEALINLAWPGAAIRVLCPYDKCGLDPSILEDAARTHPHVVADGQTSASSKYGGADFPPESDRPLTDAPAGAVRMPFELGDLAAARALVERQAIAAGIPSKRIPDLVLAINELCANAIRHGGGRGRLRIWRDGAHLVCQIDDAGHITDYLAGRRVPVPDEAGGIGLWTANQLCDLIEVRSNSGGTTSRAHFSFA